MGICERSLPGKENSKYKTLSQVKLDILKKQKVKEEGDAHIM